MTTVTADTTETDVDDPTREKVQEWAVAREELAARLDELDDREAELSTELAELHARGEGETEQARTLSQQRREVRELREDTAAALEVLGERLTEGAERACRDEAAQRLRTIRKKCGGIAGEQPRRRERLKDAVEAAEREVEAMNRAYTRQQALRLEARALADRFDLEVPEMKSVAPPERDEAAADLVDRLGDLRLARPNSLPTRHGNKPPAERVREAARVLADNGGEESPSPELFEMAGTFEAEEWERERARRSEAEKERQREVREERRETVDTWLEDRLSDGPVHELRIREEVQEADDVFAALQAMPRGWVVNLDQARQRVGALHYRRHDDASGTYWGLPDVDTSEDSPWRRAAGRGMGRRARSA